MLPGLPPIGLFWAPAERSDAVIVGRRVAMDGFVEALARHATFGCELFVPTLGVGAAAGRIGESPRVRVRDRRELAAGTSSSFTAWHDIAFDTFRPFELRRRLGGPAYPITIAHHTLSYTELLHDNVLPLLLAQARPYDALVCSSAPARDALVKLVAHVKEGFARSPGASLDFRGRFEVIPLGVDTEQFAPRDPGEGRAMLGLPAGALVLLWVGRLSAVDKADLLPMLQAFAQLVRANANKDIRLVCVGGERPGEAFGQAIAHYASQVGIAPNVTLATGVGDDLPAVYAAADVFVSPVDNLQESFGLAVVEAMAAGVPQVVADWSGYRDIVVPGETGLLVPTRWAPCDADLSEWAFLSDSASDHLALSQSVAVDMEAWKRAVQTLVDDEALRRAMGHRSRERAVATFAHARVVARHEALWLELADLARSDAPRPPDRTPAYATPRYFDAFGHFASHTVAHDAVLAITPTGRLFIAGELQAPSYYVRWGHLSPRLINAALSCLLDAERAGRAPRVGDVVGAVQRALGAQPDAVLRHLLWLLKYDFVQVAGG